MKDNEIYLIYYMILWSLTHGCRHTDSLHSSERDEPWPTDDDMPYRQKNSPYVFKKLFPLRVCREYLFMHDE